MRLCNVAKRPISSAASWTLRDGSGLRRQQSVREAGMADGARQIAERIVQALEAAESRLPDCRRSLPAAC